MMKGHARKEEGKETHVEAAAAARDTSVQIALDAYENARMDGLCHEGAWEAAVSAMCMLDLDKIMAELGTGEP